jgi:hypothetical protein
LLKIRRVGRSDPWPDNINNVNANVWSLRRLRSAATSTSVIKAGSFAVESSDAA